MRRIRKLVSNPALGLAQKLRPHRSAYNVPLTAPKVLRGRVPVFLSICLPVESVTSLGSCRSGAYHKPVFLSICRPGETITSLCSCRSVVLGSLSQAVFLSICRPGEPKTSLCSCRSVVPWSLSQAAREGAIKLSRCRCTFSPSASVSK